ncbi:hypothetical protein Tco_0921284, partial [Tanacetum coccineum]
ILPHHSYPHTPLAFITLRSSHHQILPHHSPPPSPPSPPPSSPLTAIVNYAATSKLQCSILRLILPTSHKDEEQNIAYITKVEVEQKMLQEENEMLKEIVNRDVGDAYMEVNEDGIAAHTGTNVSSEASKSRTDEALGGRTREYITPSSKRVAVLLIDNDHLRLPYYHHWTSLPFKLVTTEYADAAAEAIALARAAVKVAKSATAMMMNHQTPKPLITKSVPIVPESDNSINDLGSLPSEENEPTVKELQLLEEHLSVIIAVRSKRQVKRRIRAAEKAEAGIVSVKFAGRRVAASTVMLKPGLSRRRGEKKRCRLSWEE